MIARRTWCALAAIAAGTGCSGATVGTIDLGLTSAPGSTVLDAVSHLRVTLTSPRVVVEADRMESGFSLAIDVDATGAPGSLIVEGFDPTGTLVAAGQSPAFAVAGLDARIVVYMAPPYTVGAAPPSYLQDGRAGITNLSAAPLAYGAILAGGELAGEAAASGGVHVYNAFDHTVAAGRELPAPRNGVVLASGGRGLVFLFGGAGSDGMPTGSRWVFDTTAPPNGFYTDLGELPALARRDEHAVQLGPDSFVLTGSPPVDLRGGLATARSDTADLAPIGASTVIAGGPVALLATRAGSFLLLRDDLLQATALSPRTDASIAALPGGRFAIVGGRSGDDLVRTIEVIDAATGMVSAYPDVLEQPRERASVAVTSRHLVVVGGARLDGTPAELAEVIDLGGLVPVATATATLPASGSAVALPNDQVLFVGSSLELQLLTPAPPALP